MVKERLLIMVDVHATSQSNARTITNFSNAFYGKRYNFNSKGSSGGYDAKTGIHIHVSDVERVINISLPL